MILKTPGGDNPPPTATKIWYDRLLERARGMAEESRQRLRLLDEHFPQALPQETLERVAESAAGPAEEERRTAPRCGGRQAQVILFTITTPETIMARVDDWSASGVGLWLPRSLEVGNLVYILPDDSPETATGALVEVRYCRPHEGGWAVGCRLVRTTLSPDQLFGA